MPTWLEPELHQEAIHKIREGDKSVSEEWMRLVTGRYAAIIQSNMDQIRAALRDLETR